LQIQSASVRMGVAGLQIQSATSQFASARSQK
jgi:hypothetical protein